MDVPWSDDDTIPKRLYRVICPNQNTHYDPENGLVAALTLPSQCWLDSTNLKTFHDSIRAHRDQDKIPSPYISLYERLSEAETYCIAASDFHGDDDGDRCFVLEINTRHPDMKSILPYLWYVHDIQVMCPKGVQLGEGPRDDLEKEGDKGGRFDSEWLCLYAVPGGEGMKVLKGSKQCRIDQNWEGENELAVIGPPRLPGGINTLEEWLGTEPIVSVWEPCRLCASEDVCQHIAGFHGLRPGTLYSHQIRYDAQAEVSRRRIRAINKGVEKRKIANPDNGGTEGSPQKGSERRP